MEHLKTAENKLAVRVKSVVLNDNMAQIIECEICLEEHQEDKLKEHLELCMEWLMFRCLICDGDYVSKEGVWNHLDLHEIADESKKLHYQEMRATYKLHQCALCNDQRGYQENLYWKHVHETHDGFILRCLDCGKNFRSQKLKTDHDLTYCKAREQMVTGGLDLDQTFRNIVLPMQDDNAASIVSCAEMYENAVEKLESSQGELSCVPLEDSKCSENNTVHQQSTLVPEKLNEDNDIDSRVLMYSPENSNFDNDTDKSKTEKESKVIPIPSLNSRSETDADQITLKMEVTVEETTLLHHDDLGIPIPNQSTIAVQHSKDTILKKSEVPSVECNRHSFAFTSEEKPDTPEEFACTTFNNIVLPMQNENTVSLVSCGGMHEKAAVKMETYEYVSVKLEPSQGDLSCVPLDSRCSVINTVDQRSTLMPEKNIEDTDIDSGLLDLLPANLDVVYEIDNNMTEMESEVISISGLKSKSETDADQIILKMEIEVEETKLLHQDDVGISMPKQNTITDCPYVGQHSKDQRGKHSELLPVDFNGQNLSFTSEGKSETIKTFAYTNSDQNIVDSCLNEPSELSGLKFKSLHSTNVQKKRTHLVDKGLRKAQVVQKGCSQEPEMINSEQSLNDCNRSREDTQPLVDNGSSALSDVICSHCGKKFISVKSLSSHIESFCKPTTLNIFEKLLPDRESVQNDKMYLRNKKQFFPTTRRTRRKSSSNNYPEPELESTACHPGPSDERSQVTLEQPEEITSDQQPSSSRQVEKGSRSISRSRFSSLAIRRTQRMAVPVAQPEPDLSKSMDCLPDPSSDRYRSTLDQPAEITSGQRPSTSRQGEKRSQSLRRSRSSPPPVDFTSTSSEASDFSIDDSSWKASESSSEDSSTEAIPYQKRMKGDSSRRVEPKFSCNKCHQTFHESRALQAHVNEHMKKNECPICGRTFKKRQRFLYHKRTAHTDPQHKCSHCPKVFRHAFELHRHEAKHKKIQKSEGSVVCNLCPERFLDKSGLECHTANVHPLSECDKCDLKFTTYHKLRYHLKSFHAEPGLKCPDCGKLFYYQSQLWRHMAVHLKTKQKMMSETGETTEQQIDDDLEQHQSSSAKKIKSKRFHENETEIKEDQPKTCSICGLIIFCDMQYHKQKAHAEPKYKCSHCPKKFYTNSELDRHETTHSKTQERNVVCKLCPRTFHDKYKLQQHVYYAHPPSESPCSMCDLKFSNHRKLFHHMNTIHIPRFKCPECNKQFHAQSALQKHMDVHSKAKEKQHSSDGSKRRRLEAKGKKPPSDDSHIMVQRKKRKMPSSELRRSNRMRSKQ